MSVKLADTLAPMGDFAIGESKDIDIKINGTNKRLQQAYEDGDLGGSAIQTDTLPIPTSENENFIYQYTGSSGTYTNGFFYQCEAWGYWGWDCDGTILYTKDTETIVGKNVYIDSSGTMSLEGTITQVADDYSTLTYIDTNDNTHECVRDNNEDMANQGYTWIEKEVSPSNVKVDNTSIVQDSSTHKISVAETYETTKTCKDIDEWNALSPTEQAKYENVILEQDETTTPISIVDMVQNGNMHAVTSNAVHDYVQPIKDVIPSNASASNKLVAKSDIVTKYNYTMVGTASLEDDIKTFVTALIALGANTYVGFFNRSGSLGTAGNYNITIYAEEGTSTFASGYIALGAGALGKTQYIVSYYKPTGSSEEWTIKQLATEKDMIASSSSIQSIQALLEEVQPQNWGAGTYQGALIINGWGVGTYQMTKTNNTSANHKTVIYGTFSTATENAQPFIATYTSSNTWNIIYTALKSYVDAKVREVYRVPYNISIANFLTRFTQIGIYKGEAFIEDSIGGTAINHWCSYDVTISSDAEVYVGDIKLTDLETGDIYVYKSYGVGAFSWGLVGKFIKSCEGFISPNQSLTVTLENFTCVRGNLVVQGYGGWNLQLRQLGQSSKVYAETSDENNFVKIVEQNNTIVNIITISNPEYNKLVLTNVGSETEHFWFVGVKDWVVN